jgi:hypothetical protein
MTDAPILFLIFNRPDTTRQVFEAIKAARPTRLFIAADGPRTHVPGEKEKCDEARKITENIDWPCEVKRLYSETNKGCKINVSSAIDWFFSHVEEGIILEDDCLPDPTFFPFCQKLLEKYRHEKSVMMISGDNMQFGKRFDDASYYFSNFPHIWGWATWKRAWDAYDVNMATYPEFKKNDGIANIFKDKKMQTYWLNLFDMLYAGKIDTWDGQWVYAIYKERGLTILPSVNLVTNLGFDQNATHTKRKDMFSNIPTEPITDIIHPTKITANDEADEAYASLLKKGILERIVNKIKSLFE